MFFFDQVEDSCNEEIIPNDDSTMFKNNIDNSIEKEVSYFKII